MNWTVCPKIDTVTRENKLGELYCEAEILPAQLSLLEKKYMVTRNEFYVAVTLLAIAISTNAKDVRVSWIYNGRDEVIASSSIGLFFRDLPVALRLNVNTESYSFEHLKKDVRGQKGILERLKRLLSRKK